MGEALTRKERIDQGGSAPSVYLICTRTEAAAIAWGRHRIVHEYIARRARDLGTPDGEFAYVVTPDGPQQIAAEFALLVGLPVFAEHDASSVVGEILFGKAGYGTSLADIALPEVGDEN